MNSEYYITKTNKTINWIEVISILLFCAGLTLILLALNKHNKDCKEVGEIIGYRSDYDGTDCVIYVPKRKLKYSTIQLDKDKLVALVNVLKGKTIRIKPEND